MTNAARADEADSLSAGPQRKAVRCLSRRVWDWSRSWRETLVHLVWFWRIGVVLAILAAGVYAWNAPDVYSRAIATAVLFGLCILLALDLFTAIFNLPLLLFYVLLWCVLSLTSLIDVFVFAKHLGAAQNRVAVLVLMTNIVLSAAAAVLWYSLS